MKKTATAIILIFAAVFCCGQAGYGAADDENTKLFKKGQKYFFQKKFEMAELLLQEVVKKDPENALAYAYLGDIFLSKQRYDAAINVYQKAIDLKPDIAENYFRLGQIYYTKKMGALAIENFNQSLIINKNFNICYYHLGLTYLMLERDKDNTIINWKTFIRLSPEDIQYENIKRALELLKDPNFTIPPKGSEVTVEEALLLGGATLKKIERSADDKKAGDENKKTNKKTEEIILDEEL